MVGLVREALREHLERVRASSPPRNAAPPRRSPPPHRSSDEDGGAEAVLWELLQNEKYVGATLSSSPARKLVRNLCASPDQYETVEMQSTDNNPTMGPVAAHRQPSSRRVRLDPSPTHTCQRTLRHPSMRCHPPPLLLSLARGLLRSRTGRCPWKSRSPRERFASVPSDLEGNLVQP